MESRYSFATVLHDFSRLMLAIARFELNVFFARCRTDENLTPVCRGKPMQKTVRKSWKVVKSRCEISHPLAVESRGKPMRKTVRKSWKADAAGCFAQW